MSRTLAMIGRLSYAHCTIVSSEPTSCPLCGATVPANVVHECTHEPKHKRMAKADLSPKGD